MSTTYTPQADSLAAQVCNFLARNPDEELDLIAIGAKFDAPRGNIHTQLSRALESGLLIRIKNDDDEYIYKRGSKLKALNPVASTRKATPNKAPRVNTPRYTPPSFDSIKIDNDPALIDRGIGFAIDWTPLLAKLQINQSFVQPAIAGATIRKTITNLHKISEARYVTRKAGEDQIRVGRVS